jgi:hypothetical protein
MSWRMRQRLIPRRSRKRLPGVPAGTRRSPQRNGLKGLLTTGIPGDPRSARNHQDRPVTPEVAGSSPVAPVFICRDFAQVAAHTPVPIPRISLTASQAVGIDSTRLHGAVA